MIKLLKIDNKHKTVSFCILTPDIEDRNWDVITSEEIIKTAHDFGANMQNKFLNIDDEDNTEIEKSKYQFVKNFWIRLVDIWSYLI